MHVHDSLIQVHIDIIYIPRKNTRYTQLPSRQDMLSLRYRCFPCVSMYLYRQIFVKQYGFMGAQKQTFVFKLLFLLFLSLRCLFTFVLFVPNLDTKQVK